MKISKIELRKLTASEGMTLTNGEVFGKEIYLGESDSPENWYEVTDYEAEKLQKELKVRALTESMIENEEYEIK